MKQLPTIILYTMSKVCKFQMILYTTSLCWNEMAWVTERTMNHLAVTGGFVTLGKIDGAAGAQESRVFLLKQRRPTINI